MVSYLLMYNRYLSLIGIVLILFIAYLFSNNRKAINPRIVGWGLLMQFLIAFSILRTGPGLAVVENVAFAVEKLYEFAQKGIDFVFGNLADPSGPWNFIFAVRVLPIVIFFGALMSLLFYLGIIQRVVAAVNWLIRPILGTSGAETVCAIANSFLGQTEAPLVIRNYLKNMTKSEMLVVMVSGMGTISGGILVVFAAMGVPVIHLLSASVMAIPATIMIAKILYPETDKSVAQKEFKVDADRSNATNALEAISMGTSDGLSLALNVGAMLISFLALIALSDTIIGSISVGINAVLSFLHTYLSLPKLEIQVYTLQTLFGKLFFPVGYLLGFTGQEATQAGQLIGIKVAINELIAYGEMLKMDFLSVRARSILTYALCGFSNFSCIGIQIGGIGALVPEKRAWLGELGLRALFGAVLANLLSAMMAALLI